MNLGHSNFAIGSRVKVMIGNKLMKGTVVGRRSGTFIEGIVDSETCPGEDVIKINIDNINLPPEVISITCRPNRAEYI